MGFHITRPRALIGAAAIFCLLVVPIAAAGGGGPEATTSASVKKKLKKLKQQVAGLQQQLDELQGQPGAHGPAGGELTGSYPNPAIANNAVDSPKVLNGSLSGADIGESTLGIVPNADRLDGKDASAFLSNVVANTTGILDPPSIAANSCFTGDMVVEGIQPGDHVMITTPQALSEAFSTTSLIPNANAEARVRFCNHSNSAIDEPARTFNVIVIRP